MNLVDKSFQGWLRMMRPPLVKHVQDALVDLIDARLPLSR
jgi:hypothetical protein